MASSDLENVPHTGTKKHRKPMSEYSASHCQRLKKEAVPCCSESLSCLREIGLIPYEHVALSEVDRNTVESAAENEPKQKKTKKSKKRVALSDVNTNTVESAAENEPAKKERCNKKTTESCPPVPPVPTGVILDIADFDWETQATTAQDEMCKDVKLLLRTVLKGRRRWLSCTRKLKTCRMS